MKKLTRIVAVMLISCMLLWGTALADSSDVCDKVSELIQGTVGTEDKILSVSLDDDDLCIEIEVVSLHNLPLSICAEGDVSGVTDAILDDGTLDQYWSTITVTFPEVGSITLKKSDIETNEYGQRYMNLEPYYNSSFELDFK